jgi:hypothetical protein
MRANRSLRAHDPCGDKAALRSSWRGPITRFVKWWASLFVLLGPLSVCPFCGQPGCGGGLAGAGVLGALGAALTFVPRRLTRWWKRGPVSEGSET